MNPEESHAITLTINGGVHRLNVHPNRTLNDVLGNRLELTGTKRAYDYKGCGSCTVLMDCHPCLSNHPSDTAVALAALDARVHVVSPRGAHATPISEFFPGHTWVDGRLQSHSLPTDEIVTEIEVPFRPTHSSYLKFALRKTWNFAIASVAIRNNLWEDLRIVLGGIATFPYRCAEAEELLRNRKINESLAAVAAALKNANPLKLNGFKVDLSKTLVRPTYFH